LLPPLITHTPDPLFSLHFLNGTRQSGPHLLVLGPAARADLHANHKPDGVEGALEVGPGPSGFLLL